MYCQTLTSKKSIVELLKFGAAYRKLWLIGHHYQQVCTAIYIYTQQRAWIETYFTDLWDSEFCLELGIPVHKILVYRLNQ